MHCSLTNFSTNSHNLQKAKDRFLNAAKSLQTLPASQLGTDVKRISEMIVSANVKFFERHAGVVCYLYLHPSIFFLPSKEFKHNNNLLALRKSYHTSETGTGIPILVFCRCGPQRSTIHTARADDTALHEWD